MTSPATTRLRRAADLLGIGMTLAYERAQEGELAPGIPVLKVGGLYVVPTAPLERALGIESPDTGGAGVEPSG